MPTTTRLHPQLWERVKKEIMKSDKGGLPNTWSARKAQLAVQEYKRRGGLYLGRKSKENPLVKWTEQEWDYINKDMKRGRYLPKKVREQLPTNVKISEQLREGSKKGQNVPYSKELLDIMRRLNLI
jgi:hypothetical protein